MRHPSRRAAPALGAIVALALGTAGCADLFSSLTPFGVGERGPDQDLVAYTGIWGGSTASGGPVAFEVTGGKISGLALQHAAGACAVTFVVDEESTPIDDAAFGFDVRIDPQGTFKLDARFDSSETASGGYTFEGLAATPGCPTSGGGAFTAAKRSAP